MKLEILKSGIGHLKSRISGAAAGTVIPSSIVRFLMPDARFQDSPQILPLLSRSITLSLGIILALAASVLLARAADTKPKVWIYTDMSDGTLKGPTHMGTVNDPDDISAMAGYLLLANEFETLGIVVASTHRKEHRSTPDQGAWANRFFGDAYRAEVAALNRASGGYPADIRFTQSCIKESGERYDAAKTYADLDRYPTVRALLDAAAQQPDGALINVLCWGTVTEPAILVNHCRATGRGAVLKKLRFIARLDGFFAPPGHARASRTRRQLRRGRCRLCLHEDAGARRRDSLPRMWRHWPARDCQRRTERARLFRCVQGQPAREDFCRRQIRSERRGSFGLSHLLGAARQLGRELGRHRRQRDEPAHGGSREREEVPRQLEAHPRRTAPPRDTGGRRAWEVKGFVSMLLALLRVEAQSVVGRFLVKECSLSK
ncbi:MAG: hypothetical protein HC841_08075 [Verrucomicrobiae bacterium]|nr:hypothetical protein [Verrucomicrobiae bacterium]